MAIQQQAITGCLLTGVKQRLSVSTQQPVRLGMSVDRVDDRAQETLGIHTRWQHGPDGSGLTLQLFREGCDGGISRKQTYITFGGVLSLGWGCAAIIRRQNVLGQ